jgi:hypothetical protein
MVAGKPRRGLSVRAWDLISRDPRASRGFKIDIHRDYLSAPVELQRQIDATVRALLKREAANV